MLPAIFGLLGVIVGGLITAGVDERRRYIERRAQRRLAARILIDELTWVSASAREAADSRNLTLLRDSSDLVDAWRTHRHALGDLAWEHWLALETTISHAAMFDRTAPWSDRAAAAVGDLIEAVDKAGVPLVAHAAG